jgi:DNA-binding LytR/AlgR family response regulator
VIDESREEEVVIYVREKNELACEIEELVLKTSTNIVGYRSGEIINVELSDVFAFSVEDCKVYAILSDDRIRIKQRLYTLEEMLGDKFVKINQSCIVNVKKIERFETTFGGSLCAVLKNGFRDYVSRRQMRAVKERIGIKR